MQIDLRRVKFHDMYPFTSDGNMFIPRCSAVYYAQFVLELCFHHDVRITVLHVAFSKDFHTVRGQVTCAPESRCSVPHFSHPLKSSKVNFLSLIRV